MGFKIFVIKIISLKPNYLRECFISFEIFCTCDLFVFSGADIVAPSDMNDGRVAAIDKALKFRQLRTKVNTLSKHSEKLHKIFI